jgi:hypothetical protein
MKRESGYIETGMIAMGVLVLILFMGSVVGCAVLKPKYNLYRAGVEKRIKVEEAKATRDSAVELAKAEVARANGVAKANIIIADSITPNYLRYFYIQQLSEVEHLGGKIIYVPTEAGLPVLEAGRFQQEQETTP